MPFDDVTIPGVAGPVSTTSSFFKGYHFQVNGKVVRPVGFPPNRVTLPGVARPVDAKIKGGLLRAHPAFVVDGEEYPTGPPTPRTQQVVALLPLVLILLVQGALGFGVVFGGVLANMAIVRSDMSAGAKIASMLGVLVVGVVIVASVVVAVVGFS